MKSENAKIKNLYFGITFTHSLYVKVKYYFKTKDWNCNIDSVLACASAFPFNENSSTEVRYRLKRNTFFSVTKG